MSNRQSPSDPSLSTDTAEESFEFSEQDVADISSLAADPPEYHTILEVWREVLVPSAVEQTKRVQPGWASRITTMYPQIKIQEMADFRDRYFGKISELKEILDAEIAGDPKALTHVTAESDVAENSVHYLNLLLLWQAQILEWELAWDCTDPASAVELGAISEVHKMFFSEKGVTAYLDNIGFQFTEDDQQTLTDALEDLRGRSE